MQTSEVTGWLNGSTAGWLFPPFLLASFVNKLQLTERFFTLFVYLQFLSTNHKVAGEFKKLNPNVPTDPREQLRGAILAVFRSWNNDRAIRYRSYNGIPDAWGTAVSVQAMAYGNMNDGCGTGVAFSRNPSTGENKFFGGKILFSSCHSPASC